MTSEKKRLQDAIEFEQHCRFLTPDAVYYELAIHKGLPINSLDKAILHAAEDFNFLLEEMSQSLKLSSSFGF